MNPKIMTAAIAVFLALTLGASKGASQCLTATGDLDPIKTATGAPNLDEANITKPKPAQAAAVGGEAEAEIWVYPTNNLTSDACNIQWAVNNVAKDGRVLLKQYAKDTNVHTDFNFGDPDFVKADGTVSHKGPLLRVKILRDLTIEGEVNSTEKYGLGVKEKEGTTVWGGNYTFFIGDVGDAKNNVPAVQPSVSIKNIRFDGAAPGPIKFNAGKGHNEVSGCSIVNYKFGQTPKGNITGAFPIIAHPGNDPSLLTGTFKIESNFIGAPVAFENLNNLMHISNANLELTISGNIIEDAYWVAIAVFGNIGKTAITNNTIYKKASRQYEGAAISVGASNPLMFSDKAYDGTTVIRNNTITVSSLNSAGILLLLYPKTQYPSVTVPENLTYEVSDNVITMNNAKAALACIGACSKTVWKNNSVKGTGGYGILVTRPIPTYAQPLQEAANFPSDNHFEENNLMAFTAAWSQLFVDEFATGNIFAHNCYGDVKPPKVYVGEVVGALIQGDSNVLANEDFHGSYPGKRTVVVLDNGAAWPPVFHYEFTSENNYVRAFTNGQLATCGQVIDRNWEVTGATTNTVSGCPKSGWPKSVYTKVPKMATGTPLCPSLVSPTKPPRPRVPKPIKPLPPVKKP